MGSPCCLRTTHIESVGGTKLFEAPPMVTLWHSANAQPRLFGSRMMPPKDPRVRGRALSPASTSPHRRASFLRVKDYLHPDCTTRCSRSRGEAHRRWRAPSSSSVERFILSRVHFKRHRTRHIEPFIDGRPRRSALRFSSHTSANAFRTEATAEVLAGSWRWLTSRAAD